MRCFIAIDLDERTRAALGAVIEQIPRRPGVRPCRADRLHITLRFLGDVADGRIADVARVVSDASASVAPFLLRLTELGVFPSPRSARVLWGGVDDPAGGCAAWLAAAERPLADLGFPAESRPFHAHVTLARADGPRGAAALARLLTALPQPATAELRVSRVTLFESRMGPGGSRYVPVHAAELHRASSPLRQ